MITDQLMTQFREVVDDIVDPWHRAHEKRRRKFINFTPADLIGVQYGIEKITDVKYYFTIEIEGPGLVWLYELTDLRRRLEVFCNYDGEPAIIDGRQYQLGDGDDEQAVFFQEGKFKIWLRTWVE